MNFIKSLAVLFFFKVEAYLQQFGNLRKKKQEDGEEYVCPMAFGQASGGHLRKDLSLV